MASLNVRTFKPLPSNSGRPFFWPRSSPHAAASLSCSFHQKQNPCVIGAHSMASKLVIVASRWEIYDNFSHYKVAPPRLQNRVT